MGPSGWPGAETGASPDPPKQGEPPDPREESAAQRADRNLGELLQELRVAGLGVQVLFGFLLSLPFTARFARLSAGQRDLYLASLVLSAVEAGLAGGDWFRSAVPRKRMKELMRRSDYPAIRDTIIWLGLMGLFAGLGIAFWSSWRALPFFLAYGLLDGSAGGADAAGPHRAPRRAAGGDADATATGGARVERPGARGRGLAVVSGGGRAGTRTTAGRTWPRRRR